MTTEQLLLDAVGEDRANSVLCTSAGRGQLAAELANRWPEARVVCHFLDLYKAQQSSQWLASLGSAVEVICTPDFPESEFDLAVLTCTTRGDGELTRDLLQCGFLRLGVAGRLFAVTDNPRDTWLGDQMERLFRKVRRSPGRGGVVYSGIKIDPLRKLKHYDCEFVFRDGPRLVRAVSRPGVFSHRRLDVGARALDRIDGRAGRSASAGNRLWLGCCLAGRREAHSHVTVTAIDANPRAVECTRRGAELNELSNITAILNADAESNEPGTYDLVLANPPYYSQLRIGEIFVAGASRAQAGGLLQLVTKKPDPYLALLQDGFRDATVTAVRQYWVIRAVRNP